MSAALHVVQIGYDDSVFAAAPGSDTLRRHQAYGAVLQRRRPGSRLTSLVVTTQAGVQPFSSAGLHVLPVRAAHLRAAQWRLWRTMADLHRRDAISVLAPQTLFADGVAAALFGSRHCVPVVCQVHHHLELGTGLASLRAFAARWALRRCAAVRAVSRAVAGVVTAAVPGAIVRTVPVPVMPMSVVRSSERLPLVLFVGTLTPVKRPCEWLDVASRVAALVPEARFAMAGRGPLLETVHTRASAGLLRGRVEVLGEVPHDELSALYARASVLLLTSASEGFGRVAVEAYRHGTPVVGTDVGGLADIVEHAATGFLHPPDDLDALAASVTTLLRDAERRRRFGETGRDRVVSRFDPDRLVEEWVSLLVDAAERQWCGTPAAGGTLP